MQLWQYCLLVTTRSLCMFRTLAVATDLGHPYWIYIFPTHGMHQWLLLQFLVLLMMDAESVRNMQSDLAVTNKQYCQTCILLVLYITQLAVKTRAAILNTISDKDGYCHTHSDIHSASANFFSYSQQLTSTHNVCTVRSPTA